MRFAASRSDWESATGISGVAVHVALLMGYPIRTSVTVAAAMHVLRLPTPYVLSSSESIKREPVASIETILRTTTTARGCRETGVLKSMSATDGFVSFALSR